MKLKFLMSLLLLITAGSAFAALSLPTTDSLQPSATAITTALQEFKSLPKQERKARISEAKSFLNNIKNHRADEVDSNLVLLTILAILLPPLAVFLNQGEANGRFFLSILLTLLFWVPGIIFALLDVYGVI